MTLFFARIPTRWARERHPRLYTANPKQLLLIDASNRATAERILATQAGPVQKHHWDGLQPATSGRLSQALAEPDIKGISHLLKKGHKPTCLNL